MPRNARQSSAHLSVGVGRPLEEKEQHGHGRGLGIFRCPLPFSEEAWAQDPRTLLVLQSDGHRFLVESPRDLRTVSSDHFTGAPAPPVSDSKWTRAFRVQAFFMVGDQTKEGPDLVFDRFLNHGLDDDGQLKVLVYLFEFFDKEATWQFASSLSTEAIRKYCFRKLVKVPALTRKDVFFSDQFGREAFGTLLTSRHKHRKEHKKRG